MARANSFSPVRTSYCQPCHGQLTTCSRRRPAPSGPCMCRQACWTAEKSSPTRARPIGVSPAWTLTIVPGSISSARATVTKLERSIDATLPKVRGPFLRAAERGILPPVATVLLAGVDLFFQGKLEGVLPGHHLVKTDSADPPDCVIADVSRIDPEQVADTYPDSPII